MLRRSNVHEPLTELLGRDALVEQTHAQLDEGKRWITVLGPPGVGKSRFIAAVAAGVGPREAPGGVWLCSLAGVRTEHELCASIAMVLPGVDVQSLPSRMPQLETELERLGRMVLVLDDVEQVVPLLSAALPRWLQHASALRCIVGTRERLGAAGEIVVHVDPLEPKDAIELFVQRAVAARGAALDHGELEQVPDIVEQLDYLPLAIELAASQLAIVSARELGASLADSVLRIASPNRAASPRHASLEAALRVSWNLLDDPQRIALETIALFEAATDATDLDEVFGFDARGALAALRDRSWLQVERGATTSHGLLGVVRAFVRERARPDPERDARFVGYIRDRATGLVSRWGDRDATLALCRLTPDVEKAFDMEVASGGDAMALGIALARVASARGPVVATLQRLEAVLGSIEEPLDGSTIDALLLRGRLFARDGSMAESRADFEAAHAAAQALGDDARSARAASALADHLRHHGDPTRAEQLYREALAQFDGPQSRARITASLAGLVAERGDLDEACELYERAAALARVADDALLEAMTKQNLGLLVQEQGELDRAETLFAGALEAHRALAHRRYEAIAHLDLAALALERGRPLDALREADAALELTEKVGDRREHAIALVLKAVAFATTDEVESAQAELERAQMLLGRLGEPGLDAALSIHGRHILVAKARREPERASELLVGARSGLDDEGASDDARLAMRILARAIEDADSSRQAMHVALDGSWFRLPSGEHVDVSSRAALRNLLACLAESLRRDPSRYVSAAELIAAGWPSRRSTTKAGKNRLHVALATLRKLGLVDHLVREDEGYRLQRALIASA